jgi:hypothetical protein
LEQEQEQEQEQNAAVTPASAPAPAPAPWMHNVGCQFDTPREPLQKSPIQVLACLAHFGIRPYAVALLCT